jgi:hypothetical protein
MRLRLAVCSWVLRGNAPEVSVPREKRKAACLLVGWAWPLYRLKVQGSLVTGLAQTHGLPRGMTNNLIILINHTLAVQCRGRGCTLERFRGNEHSHCYRLVSKCFPKAQPMVLLGDGGDFRQWGLVGGARPLATWGCALEGDIWDPSSFLSLCFPFAMR